VLKPLDTPGPERKRVERAHRKSMAAARRQTGGSIGCMVIYTRGIDASDGHICRQTWRAVGYTCVCIHVCEYVYHTHKCMCTQYCKKIHDDFTKVHARELHCTICMLLCVCKVQDTNALHVCVIQLTLTRTLTRTHTALARCAQGYRFDTSEGPIDCPITHP